MTVLTDKQILNDPVAHIRQQQPDASEAIKAVESLQQQCADLAQQEKQLQLQTGKISRQIGAAKKEGLATDNILKEMKNLSADKKQLTTQLKQIQLQILSYFETADKPEASSEKQSAAPTITSEDKTTSAQRNYRASNEQDSGSKTGRIEISLLNGDGGDWNNYVDDHDAGCIHHRSEWREIFKSSYGHDTVYLCAREDDKKIVGILPLVHIKSRLFGNQLVSMPFFQRAGAIADSPDIEHQLMHAAQQHGERLAVDHIEYRDDISREHLKETHALQTHKVNMVLDLPASEQILWQGFSAKLRAQIRRPQREQTEILIGGIQHLNDFYAVYCRNMRDLGSPAQSKQFISNILQQFPQNSWLVVIKHKQRAVAAGFLLGFGNTMEIPLASTLRDVNPLSMNMLLYWQVLQFAISKNYSYFDFGRSSKDAGTYRFKQQWGAEPKQLHWHYWLEEAEAPPSLNPSNPKYAIVISIWKRLPVRITRWLGPLLVKYIP